jgi:superfamily I DNA/RNA helicase
MDFISEQQKEIVTSTDKYKLINGCAGSRKTDTLIKCAINDIRKNKRPILFLTLVGSVTDEIKTRLEEQLQIAINKLNESNHYLGYFNNIPICISNYDAWVFYMLKDEYLTHDIGENHNEKVDLLLEKTKNNETLFCNMKDKNRLQYLKKTEPVKVGLLIIDEVQDLNSKKMEIIINLSETHKDLDVYCAGDYLQTIFYDNNSCAEIANVHAMNIFKRINPKYFNLNICKRCPKAHVDFNNLILEDIQLKYNIPQMQSDNDNVIDKPVLFTHNKVSDSTNAFYTAERITKMIQILMEKDVSITPEDIAIIMTNTNENLIYIQLDINLNELYKKLGKLGAVHMKRNNSDVDNSLDWKKAKGKTKMLSIHADKGRGHKVVFF